MLVISIEGYSQSGYGNWKAALRGTAHLEELVTEQAVRISLNPATQTSRRALGNPVQINGSPHTQSVQWLAAQVREELLERSIAGVEL